jgi:S-DNA-T family DNA segregation ATPase FtsK/SpoIIIE
VAIDNLPARPTEPPVATPAATPAPEWLTPGKEITKDGARPRGTGVVRATGRALGTSAGWLATGTRGTGRAWWRYVRAGDLVDSIEPRSPGEWQYIHEVRKKRWITCACNAGGGILGSLGAWIGTVAGLGMTAMPGIEAATSMEGAAAAVATAIYGRRLVRKQAAAELEAAEEQLAIEAGVHEDDGDPFPLAECATGAEVRVCVHRALRAEGIPVAEVYGISRHDWGWQCIVRVSEGTPEAIIAKAGDLETRFDLATNGVRPQPMVERRACAILRLIQSDPFATAPGMPYRAPKSLSITDRFRVGTSVGGDPLELSLAGVMGLWVAASGGGKTGILQALAEGTTACYDNITIDLDPFGDGLEDLHDAVRITARTNEQIEAVLLFFLVMAKGRARLRAKLGMGRKWKASPEHPAVTIFFDELPKASALAKRLYNDLLLVGRKELIVVEAASQGGQSSYLGANIAQMVALTAVGPCKVEDTRSVFGDGSVKEGYLPHRLSPATATDSKDAGHLYIQGVPGVPDEPIEYAIHEAPSAVLRQLAQERLEAGLLDPDQDSLDAMRGVDLPEYVEPVYDNEGALKKEAPVELLSWEGLLRLCGAEPPDGAAASPSMRVVADAVAVMDKYGVDRMRTEALTAALTDYDPGAYGNLTPEALRSLLAEAGAGKPVTLGQIDGMNNPRGFKRDQLAAALRP